MVALCEAGLGTRNSTVLIWDGLHGVRLVKMYC